MTDESMEKLRALLTAYAERKESATPAYRTGQGAGERKRRACADCLRNVVRPVIDLLVDQLQNAGNDASTRDHTYMEDAFPSVPRSLTLRARSPERPDVA